MLCDDCCVFVCLMWDMWLLLGWYCDGDFDVVVVVFDGFDWIDVVLYLYW